MYRGRMPNGARRRRGVGDLSVSIDPTTGQPIVSGVATSVNVPSSGAATYYDITSGTPVQIFPTGGSSSSSVTSWLNSNSTAVLIAAGAFVGLIFLSSAMRR